MCENRRNGAGRGVGVHVQTPLQHCSGNTARSIVGQASMRDAENQCGEEMDSSQLYEIIIKKKVAGSFYNT